MTYFTIKFTGKEDNTKDYIACVQGIYKDIGCNCIKKTYEVCMGGPFLRSEAERIVGQLHEAIIETSNNYVDVHPEDIVIAGGSFDVTDPYLVESTYHLIPSLL